VKPEDVAAILADPDNDRIDVERSDLFDAPPSPQPATESAASAAEATASDEEAEGESSA
jgi:hypothetical protein